MWILDAATQHIVQRNISFVRVMTDGGVGGLRQHIYTEAQPTDHLTDQSLNQPTKPAQISTPATLNP